MNLLQSRSLHPTLRRQLRRQAMSADQLPTDVASWAEFIESVGRAYEECDQLVYLVTRSERKSTDELTRSQTALAEAQRLAGLGSWSMLPGESKMLISGELARMLGFDAHSREVDIHDVISCIDAAQRDLVVRAISHATSVAVDDVTELRILAADGQRRWCQCRMRSRVDENGKVVKLDGTFLDITERRSAEENVKVLAYLDPLTGLANRTRFISHLEEARNNFNLHQRPFALLFIDLDGFKAVNDTMGHDGGDELLKRVAARLKDGVRSTDCVGRFGGDEFVVLLNDLRHISDAERLAAKLLRALSMPVVIAGKTMGVSGSIGIAQYCSDTGSVDQLLRNADTAMYAAKQGGRNTLRVHDLDGSQSEPSEYLLAHDLRQAILEDALTTVYQPIVDGLTGRMLGAEALSRWHHPQLGAVAADVFVAMAERHGLIQALSRSMMRRACLQLKRLHAAGDATLFMSLNVSPLQLQGDSLIADLTAAVKDTGVHPSRIQLEITEGMIMQDPRNAASTLAELAALGYRIALDDFGAGQSSLSYLHHLPVHCIKIDRSFVRDLIDGTDPGPILRAIVGMASGLKCETLPEGIETQVQRDQLLALGCRWMQGYFFAEPLSGQAIESLLLSQTSRSARQGEAQTLAG